ncbi:MAG: hypothetical protein R3Y59_01635 [bacterium]
MKKSFLLIGILHLSLLLHAAWQPPITNFSIQDYDAGTQNWSIRQQKNSWIYVANNYGLLEFDGLHWQLYGLKNGTPVRSLDIDDSGAIYVGGGNEFGRFVSNSIGKLDYEILSTNVPEEYKNFGEVWSIHVFNDKLYVQGRDYLLIRSENDTYEVVEPGSRIYTIEEYRGGLYVATDDGIHLIVGNRLNRLQGSQLLKGSEICNMQSYGKTGMLIGTDTRGLFLYNGNEIVPFVSEADDYIRKYRLYKFAVGEKYIAYGTISDGLVVTDKSGNNARYINASSGLQINTILSLQFDADDNLWIGLDQGIDHIILDSPFLSLYSKNQYYGSGYTSAQFKNRTYLGTNQGLYISNEDFFNYSSDHPLTLVWESIGQVWSLDKWGDKLLCSHHRGLFYVDDNFKPISNVDGFWQLRVLPQNPSYAFAGSYSGLYLLKQVNGKIELVGKVKNFNETSRNFEIDINNNVWIITSRGVELLTVDLENLTAQREIIRQSIDNSDYISISKVDGRVIISNDNYCRIVNEIGQIEEDTHFFSLMGGIRIYSYIHEDPERNLWFISRDEFSVVRYNHETLSYEAKPINIINKNHYFIPGFTHLNQLIDGRVIIGALAGFSVINLDNINYAAEDNSISLIIRSMSVENSSVDSVVYGASYPLREQDIFLKYENNSVNFEYTTSINFNKAKLYSARLLPIETEFTQWDSRYRRNYSMLKEGEYQFEVRVREVDSDVIATDSISFIINPPKYRTWWAYTLYTLLFILIIFLIYIYIRYRINESKRVLRLENDETVKMREMQFEKESYQREKEILRLEHEHTEFELKNKSQELANALLNIVNRKELVENIKQDVSKIEDDVKNKNIDVAKRRISNLQGKLTRNIEQNIDWKQFEENFDIVNDKFIAKLKEKYPWMNKNERKLCVYIRMGMYTKEIAPLLGLTVRGVEMLRYRMRKKMELNRNEDLESIFQSIHIDS